MQRKIRPQQPWTEQHHGTTGVFDDTLGYQRKEARELQVRDHDHHSEQEDDGVEINGGAASWSDSALSPP
jgi:hypothetical protein